MIGSAPFLFPAGTMVPDSGTPPSNDELFHLDRRSQRGSWPQRSALTAGDSSARGAAFPERSARVTAMPQLSREDAWTLLSEWTTSESLLPAHAGRRGGDAGLCAAVRRRRRAVGPDRACCTTSTTSAIPTSRTAIPATRCASSRRAAIRPSSSAPSPRTPTSSACRATRRWRRRCTPSTSCPGSSSPCAYVRPEGLSG